MMGKRASGWEMIGFQSLETLSVSSFPVTLFSCQYRSINSQIFHFKKSFKMKCAFGDALAEIDILKGPLSQPFSLMSSTSRVSGGRK